jgi:hypothetical protein
VLKLLQEAMNPGFDMFVQYPELAFVAVQLFLVERYILLNLCPPQIDSVAVLATRPDPTFLFEFAKLSASIDFSTWVCPLKKSSMLNRLN